MAWQIMLASLWRTPRTAICTVHPALVHPHFKALRLNCSSRALGSMPRPSCSPSSSPQLMSIAPMMDWTDVHYRQLARIMTKHTWLWTEMVVDNTIIHAPCTDAHLWFPPEQHPIVLQVGGSDPELLRRAAAKAAEYGYDEINLNCGCPSDRVAGAGCFGATLMLRPKLVAQCMTALKEGCPHTPVTVKCRIGVDDADSYAELCHFIETVAENSPVRHFIIHSRKCLLKGLSPQQNRTIPPLRYGWVYALKRDFPDLEFTLNGGIQTPEEVKQILEHREEECQVAGVMVGRAAFHSPWQTLAHADSMIFGTENPSKSRRQVIEEYCKYGDAVLGRFGKKPDGRPIPDVRAVVKPILNLFHGARHNRKWKSTLDKLLLQSPTSVSSVMQAAMHVLEDSDLDEAPGVYVPLTGPEPLFSAPATGKWPPSEIPPPFGRAECPAPPLPAAAPERSPAPSEPERVPGTANPVQDTAAALARDASCAPASAEDSSAEATTSFPSATAHELATLAQEPVGSSQHIQSTPLHAPAMQTPPVTIT